MLGLSAILCLVLFEALRASAQCAQPYGNNQQSYMATPTYSPYTYSPNSLVYYPDKSGPRRFPNNELEDDPFDYTLQRRPANLLSTLLSSSLADIPIGGQINGRLSKRVPLLQIRI